MRPDIEALGRISLKIEAPAQKGGRNSFNNSPTIGFDNNRRLAATNSPIHCHENSRQPRPPHKLEKGKETIEHHRL